MAKKSTLHAKDWCADLTSCKEARRDRDANIFSGSKAWAGTHTVDANMTAVLNMAQEMFDR